MKRVRFLMKIQKQLINHLQFDTFPTVPDIYIHVKSCTHTQANRNVPLDCVVLLSVSEMSGSQCQKSKPNPPNDDSEMSNSGIQNERILMLVFKSINWDPHVLCLTACVSRKLRAVAKRLLWRELCVSRAPRMVAALINGAPNGRVGGGWHALAKLLLFCCGCQPSRHFRVNQASPGHLVKATRFSKTSGRSFLKKRCQGDLLYVSDPCEHPMGGNEDDLGIYRGVFRRFMNSRTRAYLIGRRVEFEEKVRCPYCGARVWSMTAAKLVPKSASRRLGSHDGGLEYFVCVNGHLHGTCWLAPLSSDDEDDDDDNDYDEDEGGVHGDDRMDISGRINGGSGSSEEETMEMGDVAIISTVKMSHSLIRAKHPGSSA